MQIDIVTKVYDYVSFEKCATYCATLSEITFAFYNKA